MTTRAELIASINAAVATTIGTAINTYLDTVEAEITAAAADLAPTAAATGATPAAVAASPALTTTPAAVTTAAAAATPAPAAVLAAAHLAAQPVTSPAASTPAAAAKPTLTAEAPLSIVTALPSGKVGAFYSATLTASGGTGSLHWSATGLPAGISLSEGGGLTGTPTTTGNFALSVTVTDSATPANRASETLHLSVSPSTASAAAPATSEATHLQVSMPGTVVAGTAAPITVTALDATGTPVAHNSTVALTTTDPALPKPAATGPITDGVTSASLAFKTPGSHVVTVTDAAKASVTGSATVVVIAPRAPGIA